MHDLTDVFGYVSSTRAHCPTPPAQQTTAERKTTSKLLAPTKTSDKIYQIDGHVSAVVAGLTSDANILINQARCVWRAVCMFAFF